MTEVLCGQQAARCMCGKQAGHEQDGDAVHACAETERCGGQWTGTEGEGTFTVVRLPSAGGLGDLLNDVLDEV